MANNVFRGKNVTVQVIDRGWNRIQREVKKLDDSHVKVGVLPSAGTTRSPSVVVSKRRRSSSKATKAITMAQLAAVHEHGSPKNNIPSRPFMKQAHDSNKGRLAKSKFNLLRSIYAGALSARQALDKLGIIHEGQVKRQFVAGSFKPLKPATIARKKSSKPLIDTGALRSSVDHEVVMK